MELANGSSSNAAAAASSNSNEFAATEDDHASSRGHCGWACWRPSFLQRLATPKSFLFWIVWAGGFQSFLINGLINVSVSTIERRYELTSTDTGIIVGAFDLASFLTVLPISYFGGRKGSCKPRWVGCGVLLLGLGSFIFAVPHFASGLYQASAEQQIIGTCSLSTNSTSSSSSSSSQVCPISDSSGQQQVFALRTYKYVFVLAQLIMGVGGAPLYTLGVTFIDDNVSRKMQPVYSGIFYSGTMLGPALGYVLGGQFLRLYVDFDSISAEEVGMVPGSSVWIGAWWLGFIIISSLLCIASIPLFAFPSELPGSRELTAAKEAEEAAAAKTYECDPDNEQIPQTSKKVVGIGESLGELPAAIKDLAVRWTFIFICLEESCEAMMISGFGTFIPKIVESQFALTPAEAALILGALVVPCGCGGSFLGGYLIKKFQMKTASILKFSMLLVLSSLVFSLAFLVSCPSQEFAGVTTSYTEQTMNKKFRFDSKCNSICSCSLDVYKPICGVDNILYYSPCYAGCFQTYQAKSNNTESPITVYSDCSCINAPPLRMLGMDGGQDIEVMATKQKCKSTCTYQLYLFTTLLFIFLLLTIMNSMPILSATLRVVPVSRRSFALGAQTLIWRLLGAIPGPTIFGQFIDSACLQWKKSEDGCSTNTDKGSCLIYDNHSFSIAMVGLAMTGKSLTFLFSTLAWWFYNPPSVATTSQREAAAPNRQTETKDVVMLYAYDNAAVDPS